ncbi:hypothetical protein [Thermoflavimicrobium dichotomicum]|uniref:Uncharacterized protein n=1 Tax=Thermoflavimicrobium dichotomicum TaxID=46223 RepID=A0A1I3K8X9_9BACL|nr:hypothetical protein [Thermoflavimicrobium dichotomicum]SFI68949.1 hypothetical protein SAMN05421852_101377 [Thermoflavimicrobium dichotomicum]
MNFDHYVRHGGVHFTPNVSPEKINQFVNQLPESKRESMYQVMQELAQAGLITVHNDRVWADGEGKIGGSNEC